MHQRDLPDNRFGTVALLDVIHLVEAVKARVDPDLVFCHHAGDMNQDHLVVAEAVLTAFRPLPGRAPGDAARLRDAVLDRVERRRPTRRRSGPTGSRTRAPGLERKVAAMAAYESELREWPHPRSLEGIRVAARKWGMTVGLEAAEPFMLLRRVSG